MLKRATPMRSLIAAVIAGFIAGAIHPGDNKAGFIITSLLGISGSLLAACGGRLLGLYDENAAAGFIASVLGALLILFVYNKLSGKPAA